MKWLRSIDPVVKKETLYIGCVTLVLTTLMEAVFLIIGKWDLTVLLGGLLGAAVAVLNFFLMAFTVQRAVGKEKDDAAKLVRASQSLRMVMQVAFCAAGAALPGVFNLIALVLPLLFPRIAVMLHPYIGQKS